MADPDRFRDPGVEIDDRRGIKSESLPADQQVCFSRPVQIYPYLHGVAKAATPDSAKTIQIKKKKLFRKAEIFKEQEITGK